MERRSRNSIAYIDPSSSWENGYFKGFIPKLRDKLPNLRIFFAAPPARICRACARGDRAPQRRRGAAAGRTNYGERPPGQLTRSSKIHALLNSPPGLHDGSRPCSRTLRQLSMLTAVINCLHFLE